MVLFRNLLICAACWLGAAGAAQAFELFGIKFLEGDEDAQAIDIIDPFDYRARLSFSGPAPEDLRDLIAEVSATVSGADQPAPGAAGLIARARGDYRTILSALYAEGYYSGAISIRIGGREAAGMDLIADLPQNVLVDITVEPGPLFRFGRTEIVNAAPENGQRRSLSDLTLARQFAAGQPAHGTLISDVAAAEIENWRHAGHPRARIGDQELIADHDTNRLDATIIFDPGPAARISGVSVTGSKTVDPVFLRRMAQIEPGTPYDPDQVRRMRDRLSRLGVFNSVRVREPEEVGPDGAYPLEVTVTDRKPRRIGGGAAFSSVDGLGLEAFWLHRNLFGRAERLRFDARADGIQTGEQPVDYDYEFSVSFLKPGVITPDTNFTTGFTLLQDDLEHYRERSAAYSAGLTHIFSPELDGALRVEAARTQITDDGGTSSFSTLSLVARATLDRRDDSTDPRRGYFLSGEARPFHEFVLGNTALKTEIDLRGYFAFGETLGTVLAGRLVAGSIIGGVSDEIPDSLLFYTGGGGSVRGYPYRGIGVGIGGDIEGGRSLLLMSGELRHQFTDTIGIVGFADGGYVSLREVPGSDGDLRIGAGLGLRYYTGIGPIRFDVAVPLDPMPGDPGFAYYIGIGQAF